MVHEFTPITIQGRRRNTNHKACRNDRMSPVSTGGQYQATSSGVYVVQF